MKLNFAFPVSMYLRAVLLTYSRARRNDLPKGQERKRNLFQDRDRDFKQSILKIDHPQAFEYQSQTRQVFSG